MYPEYSSQSLRDESPAAEEVSPHSDAKRGANDAGSFAPANDADGKRLKLPAISKTAWTPNSSKRVSFNRLDDEAAKLSVSASVHSLRSPPRPQKTVSTVDTPPPASPSKSVSNQASVDGSQTSQDDELPGRLGGELDVKGVRGLSSCNA